MEFKGTPRPWEYSPDNSWECGVITSKDTHYIEVKNFDIAEDACIEMYHNAKLIAAAPDLLEALQKLLKSTYPNYKTVDDSMHPANLALKAIEKAIS